MNLEAVLCKIWKVPFSKAVRMAISMSCCPSEPIRKTVICSRSIVLKNNRETLNIMEKSDQKWVK